MPAKADYEKIISGSGFSRYSITEVNRDRYFADSDEMVRWIDQPGIVPFIHAISDEWREAFRGEIIKSMLERTLQPDGTCFEEFRRIHVKAVK